MWQPDPNKLFYVAVAGLFLLLGLGGVIFLVASYAAAAVISLIQSSSLAALIGSKVATHILPSPLNH